MGDDETSDYDIDRRYAGLAVAEALKKGAAMARTELIWTGDPKTQEYEPWLTEALQGKTMIEIINGDACLRFGDGAPVVAPGETVTADRVSAAPAWFFRVIRPEETRRNG